MTKTKFAITVRVDYDTLTELHKLTANSKTNDFADVAGDLLDKAAAPTNLLICNVVSQRIERTAKAYGISIEKFIALAIANELRRHDNPVHTNSAQQFSEETINLEQR